MYLKQTAVTSLRFAVIGAGRLGASLALALRNLGATLVGFTARSSLGRRQAAIWLGSQAVTDLAELVLEQPELYFIAVPDQAVPEVALQLAQVLEAHAAGTQPVVAHTSGATSVTALDPCKQTGAATMVFHPLQTFTEPLTGSRRFQDAAIGITPSDQRPDDPALTLGFAVARALGARPFLLPDEKRGLYHAAATLACNYLVTLEHVAERLFVQAGLPPEEALSLFMPLVRATLDNIATQGTVASLTGPLSRGDLDTISRHLSALESHAPDLLAVYQALGLATLSILQHRNELAPSVISALGTLLKQPRAKPHQQLRHEGGA